VDTLPLYAYRCTECGHRFEKIQNFSAEPEHVCPKCSGVLERPLTAPRLHFKGAGWYVNDYAAKTPQPSQSSYEGTPVETKTKTTDTTKTAPAASTAPPASATPAAAATTAAATAATTS